MLNGCSTMFKYDPFPLLKRKEKKKEKNKERKEETVCFFYPLFLVEEAGEIRS